MSIYQYIQALLSAEMRLVENYIKMAEYHKTEQGIYYGCQEMASISNDHIKVLKKEADIYLKSQNGPDNEIMSSFIVDHEAGLDLTSDLHFMWLLTMDAALLINILLHASSEESANDDLQLMCNNFERETEKQSQWLMYRINLAVRRSAVHA
ncbi:MAG: hypothetical protein ACM3UT_00255 [Chloroflexota bacterium]